MMKNTIVKKALLHLRKRNVHPEMVEEIKHDKKENNTYKNASLKFRQKIFTFKNFSSRPYSKQTNRIFNS